MFQIYLVVQYRCLYVGGVDYEPEDMGTIDTNNLEN